MNPFASSRRGALPLVLALTLAGALQAGKGAGLWGRANRSILRRNRPVRVSPRPRRSPSRLTPEAQALRKRVERLSADRSLYRGAVRPSTSAKVQATAKAPAKPQGATTIAASKAPAKPHGATTITASKAPATTSRQPGLDPGSRVGKRAYAAKVARTDLKPGETLGPVHRARLKLRDGTTRTVSVPPGKTLAQVAREKFGKGNVRSVTAVQYLARNAQGHTRPLKTVVATPKGYRIRPDPGASKLASSAKAKGPAVPVAPAKASTAAASGGAKADKKGYLARAKAFGGATLRGSAKVVKYGVVAGLGAAAYGALDTYDRTQREGRGTGTKVADGKPFTGTGPKGVRKDPGQTQASPAAARKTRATTVQQASTKKAGKQRPPGYEDLRGVRALVAGESYRPPSEIKRLSSSSYFR